MKKLLLIAAVIFTALGFSSCEKEITPMAWEFTDYDNTVVKAVYTPDYVYQVAVAAPAGYVGEITLLCTNYTLTGIESNTADDTYVSEKAGIAVSRIDAKKVKITFTAINNAEESAMAVFSIAGKNGKETNITNVSVSRLNEKE